jgi:type I restriction enzyme S subunit
MSWKLKPLGEIVSIKGGKRLPKGCEFSTIPNKHLYIRARDIKEGKIDIQEPVYIDDKTFEQISNYIVNKNDVVITIVGANIGDIGEITEEFDGCNLTENAVKLFPNDLNILSPKFLKYSLFGDNQKIKFQQIASGSAQGKLGIYKIKTIEINLPPLPIQKRIASILSAYDDLIENNLKRIKLLEETAQNIYNEWFVHFRFPNHEHTPFNEETGLPEGWEMKEYSKCANFINGFAFKPHHHSENGMPIIKIKELKGGINNETPRYNGDDVPEKYFFGDETILFSWSADINVYWWSNGESVLNQHLFKVVPFDDIVKEHFYFGLKNSVPEFISRANGSTMKHIKRSELDSVYYTKPTEKIGKMFQKQVRPILKQIVSINSQNQKLKEARDILLPRLMNRTIEV